MSGGYADASLRPEYQKPALWSFRNPGSFIVQWLNCNTADGGLKQKPSDAAFRSADWKMVFWLLNGSQARFAPTVTSIVFAWSGLDEQTRWCRINLPDEQNT